MYCYCIEKSENPPQKRSANKNGYHFENFWGCLQVFVLWGLAGMYATLLHLIVSVIGQHVPSLDKVVYLENRRLSREGHEL